ncbi:shikimate dehydrogenase [Paenibacillus beijingensis]|uniref:Shikimate dehydrogenase (NADP(+)) n=1 Tax=Paenibacillus beijingensis TaxID=1126833 RepID=A0A0D5NIH0_9BACL|nr:shikimate dehydrogenase [Paenibacillus beijingensis]AJY75086.1 shikimate dehydrogenase [Paenibacillus beijingensis]
MKTNFRLRITGALGFPIDENPSPVMFEAGFASLGLDWRYQLIEVRPEHLKVALQGVQAMQFDGLNLTIPHKVAAIPYMDDLSKSASIIGAINTVLFRDGRMIGENTDGKGFVISMEKNGINLQGKRLVVLGAGGASRAICVECALAGCDSITIINGTIEKAKELETLINEQTSCRASVIEWTPGVRIPECDILINATPVGLYPDPGMPDICYDDIRPGMIVQDIIPNPAHTPFYKKAKELGATVYDGQSMLVYQGALAIELWTGLTPSDEQMKDALHRLFAE